MKPEIEYQRKIMKRALSFLDTIESCEYKIQEGGHVKYFLAVKQEAVAGYTEEMTKLLESAIVIEAEFSKEQTF